MSGSAFQIGGSYDVVRPAGLSVSARLRRDRAEAESEGGETCGTADLEVRATTEWPDRRVKGIEWAHYSFGEVAADDVTPMGFRCRQSTDVQRRISYSHACQLMRKLWLQLPPFRR